MECLTAANAILGKFNEVSVREWRAAHKLFRKVNLITMQGMGLNCVHSAMHLKVNDCLFYAWAQETQLPQLTLFHRGS